MRKNFALLTLLAFLAGCPASSGSADLAGARDGGIGDGGIRDGGDGGEVSCGQARGDHLPLMCDPSGAEAEGACRCVIGWHFNGTSCVALGGCRCVKNCDRVYAKIEECQQAYVLCLGL